MADRNLQAGVGSADITPPVGIEMGLWTLRTGLSRGIHDRMFARALVLDAGRAPVAVVSVDVGMVSKELADRVRALVAAQTAIPGSHVLLNCSHTHTSPYAASPSSAWETLTPGHRAYLEALPHYLAGAIIQAWHHLEDAAIGAASTTVPGITTNRRDPALPVDPELGVIRVDARSGRPLACLVNYACHGTTVGAHELEWTADFPGYLCRTIEGALPGCACLYLQGAEGDIHPWDWYFGNPNPRWNDRYEGSERLGRAIAGPALGLFHQIEARPAVEISIASAEIRLPPRPIRWTAQEAEAYLAHLEATTEPYRGEVIPDGCPGCMSAQRYPGPYRLASARREAEFARDYPAAIDAELTVLRMDDADPTRSIALAAIPGELYSGLGTQIKRQSPVDGTFVLSLTNGAIGYIPTREAVEAVLDLPLEEFADPVQHRRHYGATSSNRLGPGAGELLVAETVRLIGQV